MKTAEITKVVLLDGSLNYDFDLLVDGKPVGMSERLHPAKSTCLQILKDHFTGFEIIDKTGE